MARSVLDTLNGFGGAAYFPDGKPNRYHAKPVSFPMTQEGMEEFNRVYRYVCSLGLNQMVLTKSGGIAQSDSNIRAVDTRIYGTGVALYVTYGDILYSYIFGYAHKGSSPKGIYPAQAWVHFVRELKRDGVDIDSDRYRLSEVEGRMVKATIPPALISMEYHMGPEDPGLTNCHHIDFHSSYPAGLANTHPEFRKTLERLYDDRHMPGKSDIYKAILNYSIGAMQSTKAPWKARWAHLAKDAIEDNVARVMGMASRLTRSGHEVLGYNTDGIWYRGDIYHGEGEGDRLGQWRNDHTDCTFRSKSNGAYEFIEGSKYNPVLRGTIKYDGEKPRSQWQWGDIYRGEALVWKFTPGEGLSMEE